MGKDKKLKNQKHGDENAIVYCVDDKKEYIDMLWSSIKSVRKFNKKIKIIILTSHDFKDKFLLDPRIEIIKNNQIFGKFPADKCAVGKINIKNILMIDVDTFVFGDIEQIFYNLNADVSARPSNRYSKNWEEKYDNIWKANNSKLGISNAGIINAGVVVFKNNAHKKIYKTWVDIIKKFYDKEINEIYGGEWMFEQFSLSMAIAKLGLKLKILDKKFHIFGWNDEELEEKETLIIHTSGLKYKEIKNKLKKSKRI